MMDAEKGQLVLLILLRVPANAPVARSAGVALSPSADTLVAP